MWSHHTDIHVIVVGVFASAVFGLAGLLSSQPGWFAPVFCGLLVFLVLNPMIVTRAVDKRGNTIEAWGHLLVNEFIALGLGGLVATILAIVA